MKNEMPKLPYADGELSSVISQQTVQFHYGKHLQTYVNNLTNLIKGTEFEGKDIEEIIVGAPEGGILNNAGQVFNHTYYFMQLTSAPTKVQPIGKLADAIIRDFGSFDDFKKQMSDAAVTLFGSGWAWLSSDSTGKLTITKDSNAGTPLRGGKKPIFCIDVWEHAYYLDYQNRRADHVADFWKIVNWDVVEARYE